MFQSSKKCFIAIMVPFLLFVSEDFCAAGTKEPFSTVSGPKIIACSVEATGAGGK
jgi:hypothetical protein